MERIVSFIDNHSTARNLILSIISSAIVVTLMGFATQSMVYDIYGDVTMPDTRFAYTYNEILEVFNTLGSEGLGVWLLAHSLDFIFPITYSFSIAFAISMLVSRFFPERDELKKLNLIGLLGGDADYVENILVASQALSYPNLSPPIIQVASIITTLKWVIIMVGFGLVFAFLIALMARRATERFSA
ncbi:MAG: hypothetical protein ACXABV_07370 [Candidatus Thorarchaeota archaeon]|jgi:hypothetical protein